MTTRGGLRLALAGAVLVVTSCSGTGGPTLTVTQTGQPPQGAGVSPTVTARAAPTSTPIVAAPVTPTPAVTPAHTPAHTPAPSVQAASPKPVATTAAPKPSAAGRTFTITPGSGPPGTTVTYRGTGCVGDGAGFALTFINPSGQEYTGDGGSSNTDGTWQRTTQFTPNIAGGVPAYGAYQVRADCRLPTSLLFSYGTRTFDFMH